MRAVRDDLPHPTGTAPAVFHSERLAADDGHTLHIDHAGTAGGLPVLVLHGGPGSGQSPALWQGFDGRRFHIIAPDQRGAGRSTPAGETRGNTLPALLADLRQLRRHLGLGRWLVVGGSWGATLAVAHAADEPGAVTGLLLRSSFLGRPEDITGFFTPLTAPGCQDELAMAEATAWHSLCAATGCTDPQHIAQGLQQVFHHGDLPAQDRAAIAWQRWEAIRLGQPHLPAPPAEALPGWRQRYRIQAHFLAQACGLASSGNTLIERAASVALVPTLLLHADNDAVCPPEGAHLLHQAMAASQPPAALWWAPGAGHGPGHPAMAGRLRAALDHWASHGRWPSADPLAARVAA